MTNLRLGFLGTGWIGRNRLEALCASECVDTAVICDSDESCRAQAQAIVERAGSVSVCEATSLDELLDMRLDGVVIATPSALHASQAIKALRRGVAVFCQKPLGRNGDEVRDVVQAARESDKLLAADFSYRHLDGMRAIRALLASGHLGQVYAADLVFHNAYGPDKPWFYDRTLSGGGCVIDLGVHLVDLALWSLGYPSVQSVSSHLRGGGMPLHDLRTQTEDFATAELQLCNNVSVRLACSWRLHAGREAIIEATFYGTNGSASLTNVNGSFFDFEAWHLHGTTRDRLAAPPDDWGGRAAVAWARQLASDGSFDGEAERFVEVAGVIDRIYAGDSQSYIDADPVSR